MTYCANGHDLTQPGAYAYANSGLRSCRACQQVTSKRRTKGQGFSPSWLNQYTDSPRPPANDWT